MSRLINFNCPEYICDDKLDLEKISSCIDKVLVDNFADQNVILRGIQSGKHNIPRNELIQKIIDTGTDIYKTDNNTACNMSDRQIDMFGMACKITPPITLKVLEGFHKFKPKSLEHPQYPIDIWMVYDPEQLENIEYIHNRYHVKVSDGYIFKNQDDKTSALLAVFVMNWQS